MPNISRVWAEIVTAKLNLWWHVLALAFLDLTTRDETLRQEAIDSLQSTDCHVSSEHVDVDQVRLAKAGARHRKSSVGSLCVNCAWKWR